MAVRNIVFDFDGVIGDTKDLLYALSLEVDPSLTDEGFTKHFDGNMHEMPAIRFPEGGSPWSYDKYAEQLNQSHIEVALPTLKKLSGKYRMFINSSNEECGINKVLKEAELLNSFEAILGADTHTSKIKKFEILRDDFAINFTETVFITDTLGDINEGNEIGVKVIAETFGFHSRERLTRGNPYAIVDSWGEIEAEIEKLAGT